MTGGAAVVFNDVETLKQKSPGDRSVSDWRAGTMWPQTSIFIESRPRKKKKTVSRKNIEAP